MKRNLISIVLLFYLSFAIAHAQELNCRVQVNADQIQGTNKQVFTTLQNAITEFINSRKWTETQVSPSERIECSLLITIKEIPQQDRYKAEIQLQAKRPVFNTSYSTTTLNFKDPNFEFQYQEFEPLIYNEQSIESNLTAVIIYYVNIILAIDFDSFSSMGGTPYFQKAEQIVNLSQASASPGWKAFESPRNRHGIVSSFLDPGSADFRKLWYNYHRLGLDQMSLNVDKGRTTVTESIDDLKKFYQTRPSSVLITMFGDSKLDELINIYSKAGKVEKEQIFKLLNDIYPTQSSKLGELNKDF